MKITETHLEIKSARELHRIDLRQPADDFKSWESCVLKKFAPGILNDNVAASQMLASRVSERVEPEKALETGDKNAVVCLDDSLLALGPKLTGLDHVMYLVSHALSFQEVLWGAIEVFSFGYALPAGKNGFESDILPHLRMILESRSDVDVVPCSFYQGHEDWPGLNELSSRFAGRRYTSGRLRLVANRADSVAKSQTRSLYVALALSKFQNFELAQKLQTHFIEALKDFNGNGTNCTVRANIELVYRAIRGRSVRDQKGRESACEFLSRYQLPQGL